MTYQKGTVGYHFDCHDRPERVAGRVTAKPGISSSKAHILTVHLEDFFQVGPLRRSIPQRYWHRFELRAEQNTERVLDMLDAAQCKATFFTLGWIADHARDLVAEAARRGHEVASKGYFHRALREMSPEEFRKDAVRSRIALERACGHAVHGYRIAREWFSPRDLWALDILAEEGYRYDSSLRPLGLDLSRNTELRQPRLLKTSGGPIWEIPLSAWRCLGFTLPISGGNYIRQLPHGFISKRVAAWHARGKAPLVFYFHVWELDSAMPRINGTPLLCRMRQYRNLEKMSARIQHYIRRYPFTSAMEYLGLPRTPAAPPEAASDIPVVARRKARGPRRPLSIVVPCYNEEPVLKYLLKTLTNVRDTHAGKYDLSFVFVDDGSTDRTWEMLQTMVGHRADSLLIRHEANRGVAQACLTGIKAAPAETVGIIDCDCTYDPEQLMEMVPMLTDGVDLVTASPYHRQGRVVNVPRWRLFLSRGLSRLYQLLLNHKFATYTACFRVYRRSAVEHMVCNHGGYLGVVEILARLDLNGSGIVEFPAVLEARLMGQSKMKIFRVIVGHLGFLANLAIRRRRFVGAAEPMQVQASPGSSEDIRHERTDYHGVPSNSAA